MPSRCGRKRTIACCPVAGLGLFFLPSNYLCYVKNHGFLVFCGDGAVQFFANCECRHCRLPCCFKPPQDGRDGEYLHVCVGRSTWRHAVQSVVGASRRQLHQCARFYGGHFLQLHRAGGRELHVLCRDRMWRGSERLDRRRGLHRRLIFIPALERGCPHTRQPFFFLQGFDFLQQPFF